MKNRVSDLRNHLFETIEALKDPEKPMDIDRAKAISDVAQTIIASAKVEVQFYELIGTAEPPKFFDQPQGMLSPSSPQAPHAGGSAPALMPPPRVKRVA